jgi:5'-nucleotidase
MNQLSRKLRTLISTGTGGHDHYYNHSLIKGTHVLRSGTDFKQLSYVEARRKSDGSGKWDFNIIRRDIYSSIPPDPESVELAAKLTASLKSKLEKPIGYTAAGLDARFRTVRLKESNIGNFVCDLMRHTYNADCCIMAAGTIRGDQIYPPGVLRLKDILDCFPFEDPVVVIRATGKAILAALENSVSLHPALEGRFPQVSNIQFEFDPNKPSGQRILWAKIGDDDLILDKVYVLATRGYMARGKDGYDSLLVKSEGGECEEIVSEENGMLISTILRQYFLSLKVLNKWKRWGPSLGRHWGAVHENLKQSHDIIDPQPPSNKAVEAFRAAANNPAEGRKTPTGHRPEGSETPLNESDSEDESSDVKAVPTALSRKEHELVIMRKVMRKWWRLAKLPGHPALCDSLGEGEFMVNWTKVCRHSHVLIF